MYFVDSAPAELLRFNSTKDAINYANRKELISQQPQSYYPTIRELRCQAPVLRVREFISKYGQLRSLDLNADEAPETLQLEGRIRSIRKSGKGLYFLDLVQDEAKVQIYASNKLLGLSKEEFADIHMFIRKGDHVSCVGNAYKTNVGELTLRATCPIKVASPCLNFVTLPDKVSDRSLINSNRVMNYLVDSPLKQRIYVKSAVTQAIRTFFLNDSFTEVQTPILSGAGTGANAEPFHTVLKALQINKLQLRVAPELWLKKLVISGFDKVFEIGLNFRNEGIDATHNPEFLTCEFYRSFTSLPQLMRITEDLFSFIYRELEKKQCLFSVLQETLPKLTALASNDYRKIEFIPGIEEQTGVRMPSELDTDSLVAYYAAIGLALPSQKSPSSLLDNLSGVYLESLSKKASNTPFFIYNQPSVMSPLAKSSVISYSGDRRYDVSLRFEMFINGKEFVNSYEEENSPFDQRNKFILQQRNKADYQDNESLIPDWNYVNLMEYGLPPTGGWGCGIDRLSMLFSGALRIEDVLTFGTLRDVVKQ
ncbi:class II aaRS and biotin synthetase [Metschnikowia bicuspidata var. bicuspidata NRRL YB-4993]|uniref:Lysyl-tRNA synthetase n=1 Tax=Metschnikowia bicuspidata var. bicuspidata NRRL YB-4993 TaxID=869754 RepID=A0A1A0HJ82_9ASCO|nr:class II aaRS and biotin synthetase [Metschnikowia bicuspidata var. bicuspidata NRRL YB-4993]OBA23898.1 class II aaRS and biotin synthetase [Metschnikowia bicuspidata var. bicuspidata NRRL YB-4993]